MSKLERWVTSGRGVVFLMTGDGERKVFLSLFLSLSRGLIIIYFLPFFFYLYPFNVYLLLLSACNCHGVRTIYGIEGN